MKSEKRVKCRIVDFIQVASKMFEANGLIYRFSEIGETVFLTREEAEKALQLKEVGDSYDRFGNETKANPLP